MSVIKLGTDAKRVKHYTKIDSLEKIISNKTWRVYNIFGMNDKKEYIRKDVNKDGFSGLFVASFSKSNFENHAMWHIYGKDNALGKCEEYLNKLIVELEVDSFVDGENFEDDYMNYSIKTGKGIVKSKCFFRENVGKNKYDTSTIFTDLIDMKYLKNKDEVFTKSYTSDGEIEGLGKGTIVRTGTFGRFKTKSWEYEEEVRLLIRTWLFLSDCKNNFLELRLKDNFFKNMKIYLSPWDDGSIENKIKEILDKSGLPETILRNIEILPSIETGMFE